MKNYNEESDKGNFLEVDVQYIQKLHELHNDLPFLPGRMKIEKVEKLVANLHDKTEYVIYIRNLNLYIDIKTDLRKKGENDFEKDFLKLMKNAVFSKTMENERKQRY